MDRVRVNEESSKVVSFTILDEASAPVPSAQLQTATLTLLDLETFVPDASPATGILNSRDAQTILNANDVTIHATSGLVTWTMQPEDNPIVTPRRQIERHRAQFSFTWSGGAFNYEIAIDVLNLRKAS